jgi:hypothetical protein
METPASVLPPDQVKRNVITGSIPPRFKKSTTRSSSTLIRAIAHKSATHVW